MKGFFSHSFNKCPNVVPTAPTSSVNNHFHLSKDSFDFNISQVIGEEKISTTKRLNQGFSSGFRSSARTTSFGIDKTCGTLEGSRHLEIIEESPPPKSHFHFPDTNVLASSFRSVRSQRKPEVSTPSALKVTGGTINSFTLRSVEEIPMYRHIFHFPYFNIMQSTVFDAVLYTDKSLVVSAPTGSGKTAVFEMALIRLLMKIENIEKAKIVYMAPMKALCTERFQDWCTKFQEHGLRCLELTGDSELDDLTTLQNVNLVCTTPEKWDSMSRRWKDKKTFFQDISLFCVDEIHILNDANRGATVEAVISRMKTLHTTSTSMIRFIAVSATLPNYTDIAEWLETPVKPAVAFNIDEKHRPVRLERFVIGYPFKEGTSDFRFDMNLSYKLRGVIETYSHGKPTLVFCSTRKSVIQTAEILAKDMNHVLCNRQIDYNLLQKTAMTIHEPKMREFLMSGVGVHHAGLLVEDRCNIEDLFRLSQLPVLVSTSTLAMGVNLPAHLVIIKSTHFYNMGSVMEYSDMQILQMIGRAGRPQFDTSASAVIMTKAKLKNHYQALVSGTQLVESSLHKNLIEHLNAEIVLQTINDIALAVEWMRHTFLYVRVIKNAKQYGLPEGLTREQVEKRLQDLCLKNLNLLTSLDLVSVQEETYEILPTETGRLMARYCIAFDTMKLFHSIDPTQYTIADMLDVVAQCAEFDEIQLRTNEKRILNLLNKDKQRETIRYPLPGKIKTKQMKVNCLLQAQLSNLSIHDFSLSQDVSKIFRVGQRVTKCLMELLYQGQNYHLLLNATLIYKGLKTKLWNDSRYVSRQLEGIGMAMSLNLVNAGYCSFQKLEEANPRDIELIVNRHPPFGNQIKEAISCLPQYELAVDQLQKYSCDRATLVVKIDLLNRNKLQDVQSLKKSHQSLLIVGDEDNILVFKWRINDFNTLRDGAWTRTIDIRRANFGTKLNVCLLSLDWVGLDILTEYEPFYSSGWQQHARPSTPASKLKVAMDKVKTKDQTCPMKQIDSNLKRKKPVSSNSCNHSCLDKANCLHQCCKYGKQSSRVNQNNPAGQAKIEPYFSRTVDECHVEQNKNQPSPVKQARITLKKFAYVNPKQVGSSFHDSEKEQVLQSKTWNADFTPEVVKDMSDFKHRESELFPSIQVPATRAHYSNLVANDVDNFIATKAYSITEASQQFDKAQEFSSVHSSDEDFCQIPGFTYDINFSNQTMLPGQKPPKCINSSTHSQHQSPEIIVESTASSASCNIDLNQRASIITPHHILSPRYTVTESPEVVSIDSQLSEQFPLPDSLDFRLSSSTVDQDHMEKSPATVNATQGSAKSPHRYGRVHAWPRSKTPSNSSDKISGSASSNSNTQSSEKTSMKDINVTPAKAKISSIFVPYQDVPISESYIPGKLFDGIFDDIF